MTQYPPRCILVPVDLTDGSKFAVAQALALAKLYGSRIEILFIRPAVIPAMPLFPSYADKIISPGELAAALEIPSDPKIHIHITRGSPIAGILEMALALPAQLIVVSSAAEGHLRRYFLGSAAQRIVRSSPLPVLTVRSRPGPIRTILAPVNFTDYSEAGLSYAVRMAAELPAHLTLLNVVPRNSERDAAMVAMQQLMIRLGDRAPIACRTETEVEVGSPRKIIAEFADRNDLVVLTAHWKTVFHDVVRGTTAELLVRDCKALVLSVPWEELERRKDVDLWGQTVHAVNT